MIGLRAQTECLVVGGGLAGGMAALQLAAAGRDVLLLERERGSHHKVCGEFLSPEAVGYLRQVGIDPVTLGAASIRHLRFSVGDRTVETHLPFTALSLSRRLLDAALLERADDHGAQVLRGAKVEQVLPDGRQWVAQCANGEAPVAPTVFLATGKHDLRGLSRRVGVQTDLVGFKMHWRLCAEETYALHNWMELFLFPGGYGGLALVEGGVANLCLVIRQSELRALDGWPEVLQRVTASNCQIRDCLDGAHPLLDRPVAVSSIPYGYLVEELSDVWRIGDQAAVIPSFTGDGMSIALHSGALAASMYLEGRTPDAYHAEIRKQLRHGMSLATTLSRAVVTPIGRSLAPGILSACPPLLRWIARATRIPAKALLGMPERSLMETLKRE